MAARKATKKATKQDRNDSYQNVFLNIGNPGDSTSRTFTKNYRLLNRRALNNIFMGDGIGRRIVEVIPQEMLRAGFTLDGQGIDMPEIESRWDELRITPKLNDALCWSRLYGGGAVVAGVNDGGSFEDELLLGAGELEFIRVYDRFALQPEVKDLIPESATFGEVLMWRVQPQFSTDSYLVHASRVFILDGKLVPDDVRQANDGWGASCLQGVVDALKDFGISHQLATSLLNRKQQGVWKAAQLSTLCSDDEGEAAVRRRLALVDRAAGVNNTIAVDSETEEYQILTGDLGGVVDVIDRKMTVISTVTGIHQSILTGENVGGLNASQNTALESFNKMIGQAQKDELKPLIEWLCTFLTQSQEWTVKFNPLSVPSDVQLADIMQKQASADSAYQASGDISQSEMRNTLRKRGWYVMTDDDVVEVPEEETNTNPNADLNGGDDESQNGA